MRSTLFEPITLRGLTVRNRLWIPPMCQDSAFGEDGCLLYTSDAADEVRRV